MGTVGEQEDIAQINLILDGENGYSHGGREILVNQQRPLFSAGHEYIYKIDHHFTGVIFNIDLKRLRRTAAAIAGMGTSERRYTAALDHVRAISIDDSRNAQLLKVLSSAFRLLDHPDLEGLGDLRHLQIDDLIYRNLALLLCSQL